MSKTPNSLAPHSGGPILPYIIVGFGDDSWGLLDSSTGHYLLHEGALRVFTKPSEAEAVAKGLIDAGHYGKALTPLLFDPLLGASGLPRRKHVCTGHFGFQDQTRSQKPATAKTQLYSVPAKAYISGGLEYCTAVVRAGSPKKAVALVRFAGMFYDDAGCGVQLIEDTGEPGIIARYTRAE